MGGKRIMNDIIHDILLSILIIFYLIESFNKMVKILNECEKKFDRKKNLT